MFLGLYLLGEEDAFDDAFFVDGYAGIGHITIILVLAERTEEATLSSSCLFIDLDVGYHYVDAALGNFCDGHALEGLVYPLTVDEVEIVYSLFEIGVHPFTTIIYIEGTVTMADLRKQFSK